MNDKDFELEDIISEVMEKKKNGTLSQQDFDEKTEVIEKPTSETVEKKPEVVAPVKMPESKPPRNQTKKKTKKKMKKGVKIALIVLIVFLSIVILLSGIFVAIVFHYIYKIDIVPPKDDYEIVDTIPPDDDVTDEPDSPPEIIDEVEQEIEENLNNDDTKVLDDKDVYNVLLIGTDSRDNKSRGRSDSMILMSINKKTEEIHMTSFMRDSYVSIPGKNNNRINAAYAYGGAELLMDTIEQNFKIKVDKYVRVNFFSFMEVIDAVGGVTITVSDAEVNVMNVYIRELNILLGKNTNDGMLSGGGTYNLTGKQALGYCRVRYVGNADFQRTQRQRDVLMKVFEKAKGLSLTELDNFLDVLLPKLTTNIQSDEIFSLIMSSPKYFGYDVYQHRVPADKTYKGMTISGMSVLGIDFDKNIEMLRKEVYNK
ncbi:MAG: LytR family transcriptional regulator [Ruminococcus sp.]|nr:LytR family transcriptional regulator [Ruminococcus sp.]